MAQSTAMMRHAKEAGFVVLDLSDVYKNDTLQSLSRSERDQHHPNAKGHRIIADRLYEELRAQGGLIPFSFPADE